MALIKCTECGKEFSDKAQACPNCGCPTDQMGANTNIGFDKTEQMLETVRIIRDRAKEAERQFDRSSERIQEKASMAIDLFGGDASNRVVELASDAKKACDTLYAAYQTLIQTLDQRCRPMLSGKPQKTAIEEVAELIGFLNEESEIENNYSASLNGAGMGNLASVKYIPTIENRMIQEFWEDQVREADAQECKNKQPDAKQKKKNQEAYEIAVREWEEKTRQLKEAHAKAMISWKEKSSQIQAKRSKKLEEEFAAFQENELRTIEQRAADARQKAESMIQSATTKKNEAENSLSQLGLLQFSEKKRLKQLYEMAVREIEEGTRLLNEAEQTEKSEKEKLPSRLDKMRTQLQRGIEKELPLPAEPVLKLPERPLTDEEKERQLEEYKRELMSRPTAKQLQNEEYKKTILAWMKPYTPYTIEDIRKGIPVFSQKNVTDSTITALMTMLCREGKTGKQWHRGNNIYYLE